MPEFFTVKFSSVHCVILIQVLTGIQFPSYNKKSSTHFRIHSNVHSLKKIHVLHLCLGRTNTRKLPRGPTSSSDSQILSKRGQKKTKKPGPCVVEILTKKRHWLTDWLSERQERMVHPAISYMIYEIKLGRMNRKI